ncbi:MAG TPA: energy-coupling factor transporter transmembrane component T [Anaerolineales bacterium]|nr:energy-coupling factor transporter transmembrane component T [Anaerolineales bacterium]
MHERLSFFVRRDSPIHSLNPMTKVVLAFSLVLIAFSSPWYWTPLTIFLLVIVPLTLIGKVAREYWNFFFKVILPTVLVLFIMQALFLPGESKIIFDIFGLEITELSARLAFRNATRIAVMVSSFTILLLTTHPSELMSDLTRRGLPGQFAYVIISSLQIIPQMQAKAQTIISAQRSRGLDTQSSFLRRAGSLIPLVGPLVFGSLVEVEERAIAIEARGFTSPKTKTSLHEIPDTSTDKRIRWLLAAFVLISLALRLWPS